MKKITVLLCSFIMLQLTNSQNLIVDDSIKLVKGIYSSFEEFKNNSPSIPFPSECKIIRGKLEYQGAVPDKVSLPEEVNRYYSIKLDEDKKIDIEKKEAFQKIWGFCDGANVYINMPGSLGLRFEDSFGNSCGPFFKILILGRLCYFICCYQSTSGVSFGFERTPVSLDFNTGKKTLIRGMVRKAILRKIIKKDKTILMDYDNEKSFSSRGDSLIYKYIKLYSEKHKDEVIRN
jgi:hypothetical protein